MVLSQRRLGAGDPAKPRRTLGFAQLHPIRTAHCDQAATAQSPVGGDYLGGGVIIGTTQVHDPWIQDLEIIAAYDAEFHVPGRLRMG